MAVTNSEFEHIELERKSLIDKKSFYKLIKDKYDLKEKEKISKKEKEKKIKENNTKKSDQALQDLYDKVKEEAFKIHKNKRNIPVLYSTVKDMYIMSNNNPEELYLQSLRINEEDKFLSKDISRQQKEINNLIKSKREEMKKSPKDRAEEEKNALLLKSNTQISRNNSKINSSNSNLNHLHNNLNKNLNNINNNINSNLIRTNINSNNVMHNFKRNNSNHNSLKIKVGNNELQIQDIKKIMSKINKDLVKDSIDRTLKFIKTKTINIIKEMQKGVQEDKDKNDLRKKIEKKGRKKMEFYQIVMEEDLPYEQEIKKLKEEKESKLMSKTLISESKKTHQNLHHKIPKLTDDLSFMSDLSLSNMDQSICIDNNKSEDQKENSQLIDDNKSKNDILICEKREIGSDDKIFEDRIYFYKPSSILSSVIKFKNDKEMEKKFKKMQNKFSVRSFLKKEKNKGTNLKNIGKRASFLKFLKYTQEPKTLDDIIFDSERDESLHNSYNINILNNNTIDVNSRNFKKDRFGSITFSNETYNNNDSILDSDSDLTMNENLSINEIDLFPNEIKENKILTIDTKDFYNISKVVNSNKLIQNIRDSIFDRSAINTNKDLTTKQQSEFLKMMNDNLNKNLFCDSREPRGRKDDKLDISHIASEKNYEQFLEDIVKTNANVNGNENNKNNNNEEYDFIKDYDNNHNITTENKDKIQSNNNIINFSELKHRTYKKPKNRIRVKFAETIGDFSNSNYEDSNFYLSIKSSKTKTFDKSNMSTISIGRKESKKDIKKISKKETISIDTKIKSLKDKKRFFIFKAKSIEKNGDKYPKANTKKFLVKEENKPYKDPLTVKQENIPDNLRGKKYYLNYLYNISDKDLKVKDNFNVDLWSSEILGIKKKFIKKKPLPESLQAFFVFNDKKLNLKRYKYFYHKDLEYKDDECSYLTHHLKYLPRVILEMMPLRIRDFGKFAVGKEIKLGALGNKSTLLTNELNANKSQLKSLDSRSGKSFTCNQRNKSSIPMNSSFTNNNQTQEELKYKRNLYERAFKKIDELNYRTLSRFFIEEDKFFAKLIDEKKLAEKIREIEIRNNLKQNKLEVKSEIINIQMYDLKTNSSRYVQWSGPDVLKNQDEDKNRKKWNHLVNALENFNVIIWSSSNTLKRIQKLSYAFYIIATNDYFDLIILGIVIINSFFLAVDGNILKPEILEKLNITYYIFNSIFILEYVVKFIGLGPLIYYSDPFTYLDTLIIGFAIMDYVLPSDSEEEEKSQSQNFVKSHLSFLRVFRIFRILRLAKVLRRLKSMRLIIVSMTKVLQVYPILLLY